MTEQARRGDRKYSRRRVCVRERALDAAPRRSRRQAVSHREQGEAQEHPKGCAENGAQGSCLAREALGVGRAGCLRPREELGKERPRPGAPQPACCCL